MWDCVDPDAIELELLNDISDPLDESLSHELVVLVQVRQVGEAAVFNLVLVAPVVDLTLDVVVLALVERSD